MNVIGERYRDFAEQWARGRSPLYEAFSLGISNDPECLRFLAELPRPKQQPNLFLASVRFVAGEPHDWPDFKRRFVNNKAAVRATMLARTTQTNEPARCATLLPALASIPGPLALLEVGASAGLCLLPDRYAYAYGGVHLGEREPVFTCSVNEATPLPQALPEIVWRAGLDLNPLGVNDPDDVAWLEVLVWPEGTDRIDRLRKAVAIAREYPPRVGRGDLRHDLQSLAAEAPKEATLVIFHTAVLLYVASYEEREAFAANAQLLGRWLSNESPDVFPRLAGIAGPAPKGQMLMTLDRRPLAWADPHGASLRWIAGD